MTAVLQVCMRVQRWGVGGSRLSSGSRRPEYREGWGLYPEVETGNNSSGTVWDLEADTKWHSSVEGNVLDNPHVERD